MTYIMERLERHREENHLSKSEMSRRLGAPRPQSYFNWLDRNSLPKEYFPAAAELLGDDPNAVAPLGALKENLDFKDSLFSKISEDERLDVLREIASTLSPEGKAAALRLLLNKNS